MAADVTNVRSGDARRFRGSTVRAAPRREGVGAGWTPPAAVEGSRQGRFVAWVWVWAWASDGGGSGPQFVAEGCPLPGARVPTRSCGNGREVPALNSGSPAGQRRTWRRRVSVPEGHSALQRHATRPQDSHHPEPTRLRDPAGYPLQMSRPGTPSVWRGVPALSCKVFRPDPVIRSSHRLRHRPRKRRRLSHHRRWWYPDPCINFPP